MKLSAYLAGGSSGGFSGKVEGDRPSMLRASCREEVIGKEI